MRRRALLVLGMHRSGTSALTGALNKVGVAVGSDLLLPSLENQKGFFESRLVRNQMERLLTSAGSFWHDWRPLEIDKCDPTVLTEVRTSLAEFIEKEFADVSLFAIKNPRICRAVPFWISLLSSRQIDAIAIIPVRHPAEVVASLVARNDMTADKALMLWMRHVIDAERTTRNLRRLFITYDQLMTDWSGVLRRIAAVAGEEWEDQIAAGDRSIGDFLTPELRHHTADEEANAVSSVMPSSADIWSAVQQYAGGEPDLTHSNVFDRAEEALAVHVSAFGTYFGQIETDKIKAANEARVSSPLDVAMTALLMAASKDRSIDVTIALESLDRIPLRGNRWQRRRVLRDAVQHIERILSSSMSANADVRVETPKSQ